VFHHPFRVVGGFRTIRIWQVSIVSYDWIFTLKKMIKDMLHHEIKIITLICASLLLFSCKRIYKEEIKQIDMTAYEWGC
jgi:hypothetical protein